MHQIEVELPLNNGMRQRLLCLSVGRPSQLGLSPVEIWMPTCQLSLGVISMQLSGPVFSSGEVSDEY